MILLVHTLLIHPVDVQRSESFVVSFLGGNMILFHVWFCFAILQAQMNGPHKIYVVVKRKKHELSKDEYTGIIKRFGSEHGFVKLDMTELKPTRSSAQLSVVVPQKAVTENVAKSKVHAVKFPIKNAPLKKDAGTKAQPKNITSPGESTKTKKVTVNAFSTKKTNVKSVAVKPMKTDLVNSTHIKQMVGANKYISVNKTVRVNGRTIQYTANTALKRSGEWVVKDVRCVTTTTAMNHSGNIPWTMTWADAIDALYAGYLGPFLDECLRISPHAPSLFWETPAFSRSTLSREFEFVTLPAPHMAHTQPDASAFAVHLHVPTRSTTATFTNIKGDATLVIPRPPPGSSKLPKYGHLGDFVRFAPTVRRNALWRAVGVAAREAAKSNKPTWMSTAGSGVSWLHIRLDSHPKYYRHSEYK
jgi:hypothetical protein